MKRCGGGEIARSHDEPRETNPAVPGTIPRTKRTQPTRAERTRRPRPGCHGFGQTDPVPSAVTRAHGVGRTEPVAPGRNEQS